MNHLAADPPTPATPSTVAVDYERLLSFTAAVFAAHGLDEDRDHTAAQALCYGDLTGMDSHGLRNLTRLYLPLLDSGRADPTARTRIVTDRGASVLIDAQRSLGLYTASEAMDLATERAASYGVGVVSVRDATHFGCAGYHARRATEHGMIGIVAANCGRQRIARPPGGRTPLLGTNPLSVAAPAAKGHPFVLDMSTTAAPTGRIREAARAGHEIAAGVLADDAGNPVTDPAAFDRGHAHLQWLGGSVGTYKGFGLALAVEVLAAVLSGAGMGPEPEALAGDGRPGGRDDDIGFFVAALAPAALRPAAAAAEAAVSLFETVLACPPSHDGEPVRYPGWHEAQRAIERRRWGVPLPLPLYQEIHEVAATYGLAAPETLEGRR
ncbi:Ldh family oxidoreductase [Salinactinospora qingdaonensis]|uniref:Ldh family oxidoreductase n=1 Tax=Salinactinospora qingdaonensis TaxID=702744 RepID=A0ABP7GB68_9ACTN